MVATRSFTLLILTAVPMLGRIDTTFAASIAKAFPCVRIMQPPVIDGKLDDPCWSSAAAAAGFLDLTDPSGTALASRQTTVKLAYDHHALYMSATCLESNMHKLAATVTSRDGAVWNDDCLELFLAFNKGAPEYVHYAFNALGVYYDALTQEAAWNSDVTVAAQRLGDRWTLEAAIPFKELKVKPPVEGDTWSFNVAREHRAGEVVALSTWALLTEGGFGTPNEFAALRFAGDKSTMGSREFSNRRPTFENPSFSKVTPDGKPLHWVLGSGTIRHETAYLADTYELTTDADCLMARQDLGWRQAGGKDYNLTVIAHGEGGTAMGVTISYRTAGGKNETLRVFRDEPVPGILTAYSKKVTIPSDAEHIICVELYRSNRTGALSFREVQLTEAAAFSGVREAKREYDEHCWPTGKPFDAPVGFRWATPLSGGPLSVLLILPDRTARLAVELGQRFQMEADVAWVASYNGQVYSWDNADKINNRLSRSAKPYDVIILTVPLKSPAFLTVIQQNVNLGTGLLFLHNVNDKTSTSGLAGLLPAAKAVMKDEPQILKGVPWRLLPSAQNGQPALASVGTGSFGKGQVVTLGYNVPVKGLMPDGYALNQASTGMGDWWEYVYSLVARSLLVCANRTASAKIESVSIDAQKATVRATIAARQTFQGALTLQWTDKYRIAESSVAANDLKIAQGERTVVTLPVPESVRRSNGDHLANMFLRDEQGRAADWTVAVLPVEAGVRVGGAYPFPRDWYGNGQAIEGTVVIENRLPVKTDASVTLELVDGFNRCIWRTSKAISLAEGEKTTVPVLPSLDRVLTVSHRLRTTVSDNQGILDRREWELRLPDQWKYDPSDFRFGVETSFYWYLHTDKEFADYFRGVGAAFSTDGGISEQMPKFGMPWLYYNLGGGTVVYRNDRYEQCFNDPSFLKKVADEAARDYPLARRSGAAFCTIADELEIVRDGRTEVCFCRFCTDGFRRWAQGFYHGLDRLNAEWGTAYTSWDAVKPATAEKVRNRGNFAQWVDFRSFMDSSLPNVCAAVKERIKRDYPDALIGLTDPFVINPFSGIDNTKLARVEEAMGKYMRQDNMKECVSLNPTVPVFTHFGYGGRPEWCKWYPWWFAMNRGQFLVWWAPACSHPVLQLVDCFGRQTRRSLAVLDAARDLTAGVGSIFRTLPPARNPVAIFYSQASMQTAWAESGMRVGDARWGDKGMYQWAETAPLHSFKLHHRSQENFKALLKETSLQPDFLPADKVLEGRLSNYQMLILPYSTALSEEALAKVDDFVRAGGTVLADLRTGAYTEHGKPFATRASFEVLFGVKRKARGFEAAFTSISCSGAFASASGGKGFDQPAGRESLELTSGQAMAKHPDGSPAVIVNTRGKGRAVYLNFVPGNGSSSTALMLQILELAGVKREVSLTKEESPAIGYECFMFERGPVKFLGILRDMLPQPEGEPNLSWHGHQFRHATANKEAISVCLPGQFHVYDVREGKYLGHIRTIPAEMNPAEAKVYGLLPYKVSGIAVRAKPEYRPGEILRYQAAVQVTEGSPGDHVLRVEVYDSAGVLVSCYTKNVLARNGTYQGNLPLALNEKPGMWRLRVTDVTSKAEQTVMFAVARPYEKGGT